MSIITTLEPIFKKVNVKNKSQRRFLEELFDLLPSIRGRFNFCNFARFSIFNEVTFRRNFSKFFDWPKFNFAILKMGLVSPTSICIAVADASFISKAGKKTFGLDKFWSGCANATKKGLEISALSLIEINSGRAWTLDVTQTPSGLSTTEEEGMNKYTRIDFYIEQILDCLPYLQNVFYVVADGYYAKKKMFDAVLSINKHLITKLRTDANMRYIFDRKENPNAHGNTRYGAKIDWKNLDLNRWIEEGTHPKLEHILIYTQELYSVQFERNLKVVILINTQNGKYVLLASTDLSQSGLEIVEYYSLRFQIEFLFRDAKQFMGLNHCQARDEDKLDFHFNMSLAAINLFQLQMQINEESDKSLNSLIRRAYNTRLVGLIFDQLNSKAELDEFLDIKDPDIQKIINLGQVLYKKTG